MAESEPSLLIIVWTLGRIRSRVQFERTQPHPLPGRFDIELRLAVAVNVSEPNGPKMGQVFFLHRIAFLLEGIEGSLHRENVPNDDRVRQQIQAARLMSLALLILLPHHPFASKEEKCPQIMEVFAFVELCMDTSAQGVVFEIVQKIVLMRCPYSCRNLVSCP